MRVYLEYEGNGIELGVGETVIGRDVGCALRFNDPSVSRRHVRLVRRHDDVFAQDLGSTNGTLVNGRALTSAVRIEDGDALELGNRRVTVRLSDGLEDQPDTVLVPPAPKALPKDVDRAKGRALTTRMAVTVPPVTEPLTTAAAMRRHDRRPLELQLVYVSRELEVEATTRDLSVSGVFVCADLLDPVGTDCQLTLLIDGGPPLRLNGVVRRVVENDADGDEPVGMGVEFRDIGALERAWLEKTAAPRSA